MDEVLACYHCGGEIEFDDGECPHCGEHLDSWKDDEEEES